MFVRYLQPSPYLYNQYAGMPAAPMSAGIGQLPLQFAVSQGGPTAATAAPLDSQGMAYTVPVVSR